MRWVSYSQNGQARLGALLHGRVVDLQLAYSAFCLQTATLPSLQDRFSSMIGLLSSGSEAIKAASDSIQFASARASTANENLKSAFWAMEDVTILPPLPNPGKIICVGANFPAAGKSSSPEFPTVFLKPGTTITGPGMPILIPGNAGAVACEVELAVVIGRQAHNLADDAALACIGGYTLANDLGDRLLERRTSQWASGKMLDSFTPIGPAILTPDEIVDTRNLLMQTWVNGKQVQRGKTGEMFFSVDTLVRYISTLTTLQPGDLILTGSPKLMDGQPAPEITLKPGDTVRIAIDNLGDLTNPVKEAPG